MIHVFYTETAPFRKEDAFSVYGNRIEEKRRKQILHTTNRDVQVCSLTTGVLLHDCVCNRLGLKAESATAFKVDYKSGGKPYLVDFPNIHVNLSHSGKYACCAIADAPIGIDIQKHTDYQEKIASRFFPESDNQYLNSCTKEDRAEVFFRIWSRRESYGKLTGRGLTDSLRAFEIDWKKDIALIEQDNEFETTAYFHEYHMIPEYSLCICTSQSREFVSWEELTYI